MSYFKYWKTILFSFGNVYFLGIPAVVEQLGYRRTAGGVERAYYRIHCPAVLEHLSDGRASRYVELADINALQLDAGVEQSHGAKSLVCNEIVAEYEFLKAVASPEHRIDGHRIGIVERAEVEFLEAAGTGEHMLHRRCPVCVKTLYAIDSFETGEAAEHIRRVENGYAGGFGVDVYSTVAVDVTHN